MQITHGASCAAATGDFSRLKSTGSAKASFVNFCELPRLCGWDFPVCRRAYEGNTSGIPPAQRRVHPRAPPSFPPLFLPPSLRTSPVPGKKPDLPHRDGQRHESSCKLVTKTLWRVLSIPLLTKHFCPPLIPKSLSDLAAPDGQSTV